MTDTEQLTCIVCLMPILNTDTFVGMGDGTGQKFGHHVCYLNREVAGYKAQVAGQAHYIKCLLDEVRELNERIAEFAKGA